MLENASAGLLLLALAFLPLYSIFSPVVSKWIGETEKNLRHIFDAADEGWLNWTKSGGFTAGYPIFAVVAVPFEHAVLHARAGVRE